MKKSISIFFTFLTLACAQDKSKEMVTSQTEYQIGALNFFQTSAESRALCYQAYNIATVMFDMALKNKPEKKPAVIVDIDETVLDNSPHQATLITKNEIFPAYWADWTGSAKCQAVPGAVEFLNHVANAGAEVYYISNRKMSEITGTMKNLRSAGFPQVDSSHLMLRTAEAGKEARRQKIAETHTIVLLCGDNLNDFSDQFEKRSIDDRAAHADKIKSEWGKKFIVLPNPTYGDWESAIYNYDYKLSPKEKDKRRKEALRTMDEIK